jgi:hypothetical protein
MYVADVVLNAEKKIKSVAIPMLDSQDATEVSKAERSLKYLRQWKKTTYPLSFVEEAYQKLLQAMAVIIDDISEGLPNTSKETVTVKDFVAALYEMSKPTSPAAIQALFFNRGTSPVVMKVAIPMLLEQSNATDPRGKGAFAIAVMNVAADTNPILPVFSTWKYLVLLWQSFLVDYVSILFLHETLSYELWWVIFW